MRDSPGGTHSHEGYLTDPSTSVFLNVAHAHGFLLLQYFYEEQLHRMECLSQESVSFADVLSQMTDMLQPQVWSGRDAQQLDWQYLRCVAMSWWPVALLIPCHWLEDVGLPRDVPGTGQGWAWGSCDWFVERGRRLGVARHVADPCQLQALSLTSPPAHLTIAAAALAAA